MYIKDVKKLM